MEAKGYAIKYGDNVDTDVIIPARYLNSSDPAELALHCMEDIDKDFVNKVKKGDIVIYDKYAGIQIKDGDTEYLIVKNEEIVALIKK